MKYFQPSKVRPSCGFKLLNCSIFGNIGEPWNRIIVPVHALASCGTSNTCSFLNVDAICVERGAFVVQRRGQFGESARRLHEQVASPRTEHRIISSFACRVRCRTRSARFGPRRHLPTDRSKRAHQIQTSRWLAMVSRDPRDGESYASCRVRSLSVAWSTVISSSVLFFSGFFSNLLIFFF